MKGFTYKPKRLPKRLKKLAKKQISRLCSGRLKIKNIRQKNYDSGGYRFCVSFLGTKTVAIFYFSPVNF